MIQGSRAQSAEKSEYHNIQGLKCNLEQVRLDNPVHTFRRVMLWQKIKKM